jgi:hypothetical protein
MVGTVRSATAGIIAKPPTIRPNMNANRASPAPIPPPCSSLNPSSKRMSVRKPAAPEATTEASNSQLMKAMGRM